MPMSASRLFPACFLSLCLIFSPLSFAQELEEMPNSQNPAPTEEKENVGSIIAPSTVGISVESYGEEKRRTEAPDTTEYAAIPIGLLAKPEKEEASAPEAPKESALPASLGQIPGLFQIPESLKNKGTDGGGERVALTFDQMMRLYHDGKYAEFLPDLNAMVAARQPMAEQLLGIMYMNGQGVEKKPGRALELLQHAAEANLVMAQHYLGVMYYKGEGMAEPDPIRALMWLHIAIIHYPEGQAKERARQDRDGIYLKTTRTEKQRALELAKLWLDEKGEAHLLDMEQK